MKNVHILNGGFRSWSLKNLPVESIIYIVDFNYVNDIVQNYDIFAPHYSLIDVAPSSSSSSASHHNHIPTSIWVTDDYVDDVKNKYTNPDGTMRSGVDILAMWDKAGIDYKRKHLIFYSSNDDIDSVNEASAAEVMFYAELMGLYKISVYEGGWREWQSRRHKQIDYEVDNRSSSSSTQIVVNLQTTTSSTSTTTTQTSSKSNQNTHKQKVKSTTPTTTTASIKINHTMSSVLVNSDGDASSSLFFKEQFNKVTASPPPPHMPAAAHVTPPSKTMANSASSINTDVIGGLAALFYALLYLCL